MPQGCAEERDVRLLQADAMLTAAPTVSSAGADAGCPRLHHLKADPMMSDHSHPTMTRVATVLTPAERIRVDAAGEGLYRSIHRDSVDDVVRDVREARAAAVVLSVAYCERAPSAPVATMVREFPRIPTLALLSELGPRTPQTLMSLGTSGVRRLIDVRDAAGWRLLRNALSDECGNGVQRL